MAVDTPSRPQALLLGCIEEHDARDEPVYVYDNEAGVDRSTTRVGLVAHAEEHGPLLGVQYFLAVDESLPALVPASLSLVRRASLNACARRGWVADGGVEEFFTQRIGTSWFSAREVRLRRLLLTEQGSLALGRYRRLPPEPEPELGGVEREIVALAAQAERFGYALVPVTTDAKRGARALARTPFAKRGWGGGASTRSLEATATGEVAVTA